MLASLNPDDNMNMDNNSNNTDLGNQDIVVMGGGLSDVHTGGEHGLATEYKGTRSGRNLKLLVKETDRHFSGSVCAFCHHRCSVTCQDCLA